MSVYERLPCMNMEGTSIVEQERNGVARAMPVYPGRYARFGAFQADLANGELYQNGQRVKVQAKLFQALVVLLGRPGDIVTRDDIRRHLWPDTPLTNVDANLNTTMNKLRQVLGDSYNPLYIERMPRRGYSFIASVEFSDVLELPPVERENNSVELATQSDARRTFLSQKHIPTLLRASSLLFAGMLLGALLAFIWFFVQSKNQRAGHNLKQTASLSMRSGSGAIDLIAEVAA